MPPPLPWVARAGAIPAMAIDAFGVESETISDPPHVRSGRATVDPRERWVNEFDPEPVRFPGRVARRGVP